MFITRQLRCFFAKSFTSLCGILKYKGPTFQMSRTFLIFFGLLFLDCANIFYRAVFILSSRFQEKEGQVPGTAPVFLPACQK